MPDMDFSLKLWPPSERTRAAVIDRMVKTLSSPSILSDNYGKLDEGEAFSIAKRIEVEAFEACEKVEASDIGTNVLQAYSKEISRLIFEAVKSRASNNARSNGDVNSFSDSTSSVS